MPCCCTAIAAEPHAAASCRLHMPRGVNLPSASADGVYGVRVGLDLWLGPCTLEGALTAPDALEAASGSTPEPLAGASPPCIATAKRESQVSCLRAREASACIRGGYHVQQGDLQR